MLFATFITILLVLIQRHDATRPYISLRSKGQQRKCFANELKSSKNKEVVSVVCMGNGFAKEVTIKSRCFLGETNEKYKDLILTGNWPQYKKENINMFLNPKVQDIYFDAVMEREAFDLSFYFDAILSICCLAMLDLASNNKNINDFNLESYICCQITYKDSIGKLYTRYVVVTIFPCFLNCSGKEVSFGLACKNVSKRTFNATLNNDKYHEI